MRETLARQRTTRPGTTVDLMVLASGRRTTIGVDLESGSFVRGHEPLRQQLLRPYTVVRGTMTAGASSDRPEQPELARFSEPLLPVDRLSGWRAERLIRPLLHPRNRPLLGFHGPSAPWWELDSVGPSVALVDAARGPVVEMDPRGLRCKFVWNGLHHDLPLEDLRLLARLDWLPSGPSRPGSLERILGFRPERLVIALGRPTKGYCPKVVAGLLPHA